MRRTQILFIATYPTRNISKVLDELDCEVGPPNRLVPNFVAAFDAWSCWSIEDENKRGWYFKKARKPLEEYRETPSRLLTVYASSACAGIALSHKCAVGEA